MILTIETGLVCGSGLLNLIFGDWLREKLNREGSKYSKAQVERLVDAGISEFEWTKRSFDGTEMEDLFCQIQGLKKSQDGRIGKDYVFISRSVS